MAGIITNKIINKMTKDDKAVVVQLAEAYRKDGHRHYVKKAAEELGLETKEVSAALAQYRDGSLTINSYEIDRFSKGEWALAKQEVAHVGTQALRKIAVRIHEELDKPDYDSRAVRDLGNAYASISRENRDLMGDVSYQKGGSGQQQTNIQIVLPPKQDMPLEVESEVLEEKSIDT